MRFNVKNIKLHKIRLFVLTMVMACMSISSKSTGVAEDIVVSIKNNDADKLAEFFDSNIDLKILDKENIFSKSQACVMIKDFLSTHPVAEATINHQGGPKTARFAICNITTSDGSFRVYFLVKEIKGKQLIQKFRIEKDG